MSKREPLKNKFHFGAESFEESGDRYYSEEDIKSAVEWMLKEISKLPTECTAKKIKSQIYSYIIPIAFEDIK